MIDGKLLNKVMNFYKKIKQHMDLGKETKLALRADFKKGNLDEWRNLFAGTKYEDEYEDLITEVEIYKEQQYL